MGKQPLVYDSLTETANPYRDRRDRQGAKFIHSEWGIADRTAIEFFDGGQALHGEATFEFLHQHLNWPEP